jgi:hypothetical protein
VDCVIVITVLVYCFWSCLYTKINTAAAVIIGSDAFYV